LNVHVDFPLLERIALPITIGSVRYAGIRSMRLASSGCLKFSCMAATVSALDCQAVHRVLLESFQLSEKTYGLNQLRYDLRKLKGHGLLERDGSRYTYRLNH